MTEPHASPKQQQRDENQFGEYSTFEELQENTVQGLDYSIEVQRARADVCVIAPHAGSIEPGTGLVAKEIAGKTLSLFLFRSLRPEGDTSLHVKSTRFDHPEARRMVRLSSYTIAVHGCIEPYPQVFLGGQDDELKRAIRRRLSAMNFPVAPETHPLYPGLHPKNICNTNMKSGGVQLEISAPMLRDLQQNRMRLRGFASAIREAIEDIAQGDFRNLSFSGPRDGSQDAV